MEFSKKLLIADYFIMLVLVALVCVSDADLTSIAVAWVAQVGVSSGAYYWKAKSENRTKIPINVVKSLPKAMRDELDLTQIIISIISGE